MNEWVRLATVTLAACCFLGSAAAAQSMSDRPVRIMVGTAPGGGTDFIARLLAQELSLVWGQTAVVENRTGASGTIAGQEVVRAKPDGYTLLVSPQTAIAVGPQMMAKAPYDPLKDLTPITVVASSPLVLVANPSFGPNTFSEYLQHVKDRPGQVSFASGGMGSSPHMTQELLNRELNLKMVHIAYRGEAPAITEVLGGQVPVLFTNIPTGMPYVQAGRLKALVTTGAVRSPQTPNVPTIKESGIPVETATWNALYGPAGMDPDLVQKIYKDVVQAVSKPSVRDRLITSGNEPILSEPAAFKKFLETEVERWGKVINDNHLKLN